MHALACITVRRDKLMPDARCAVMRKGQAVGIGPIAVAAGTMRPGDVLVLSPNDYRRYRQTSAETVEPTP